MALKGKAKTEYQKRYMAERRLRALWEMMKKAFSSPEYPEPFSFEEFKQTYERLKSDRETRQLEQFYTLKEAAFELKVSIDTLRRWLKNKQIEYFQRDQHTMIYIYYRDLIRLKESGLTKRR